MDIVSSNLHHAYVLVGSREQAEERFYRFLDELNISRHGNPDLEIYRESTFGINEARKLSEQASRRAFVDRRLFLLLADTYTVEAQNALLKTFEEPIASTHFFLNAKEESTLLPTLLSRMQSIRLDRGNDGRNMDAEKFLALSIKDRISFAKKFADKEMNLEVFLDSLLIDLRKNKAQSNAEQNVYKLRRYAGDRSVSARLILEHLAVTL